MCVGAEERLPSGTACVSTSGLRFNITMSVSSVQLCFHSSGKSYSREKVSSCPGFRCVYVPTVVSLRLGDEVFFQSSSEGSIGGGMGGWNRAEAARLQ